MPWRVVMMQKPVLCTPLVGHFLPTASIKTLSTPMQKLLIHRMALKKKTPSEELPHYSRKQTTHSWSLTSSASTLLNGRTMTLPLGWLAICSCDITINLAFISYSELRMKVSFLCWPVFVGPCTKQVGFVSGHLSAVRHKFCSNLPQIFGSYVIMYYMMCLECCNHHIHMQSS